MLIRSEEKKENLREDGKEIKLIFRFEEVDEFATESEFRELFHLSKDGFEYIINFLEEKNVFNRTEHPEIFSIPFRNIVAGVILVMTSSATILDISFKVGMSPRSLQRFSDVFINYLFSLKDQIIKIPDPVDQRNLVYKYHDQYYELEGAVFAIDGTLIKKKGSIVEGIAAIDRHGNNSINAMIVYGPGCHIVNIYVNKLGSTHDSSVFRDSYLCNHLNDGILRENAFIIGDSGYPLLPKLITPYRVGEMSGGDLSKKKDFNFCHSSARMVAERGNGLLKGRMRPLHVGLRTSDSNYAVYFITSSIVLHEWLLQIEGDTPIENLQVRDNDEATERWQYTDDESNRAKVIRKRITDEIYNQIHTADIFSFVYNKYYFHFYSISHLSYST